MREIVLVTAMGFNNEIGKDGKLLCHISDDLRLFRTMTTGKVVVMGRKTFDGIGKPLPNRTNLILTTDDTMTDYYRSLGAFVAHSIEEVLTQYQDDLFIIGGGEVYTQFLPLATMLVMTRIEGYFDDADTFFPQVNWDEWVSDRDGWYYNRNAKNEHSFTNYVFSKKQV